MRRICMMVVGASLLAGCSDSSGLGAGSGERAINGTYQLLTLRGEALPAVAREWTDYTFKITDGSITLNGDRTFSDSYSYWQYNAGTVTTGTVPCSGYWTPTSETTFTLRETAINGCGQNGIAEWDGRNRVTIAWDVIGTAVHGRPWTIEDITR